MAASTRFSIYMHLPGLSTVTSFAVAAGQDDASSLAFGGTYGPEDPGRSSALIFGR